MTELMSFEEFLKENEKTAKTYAKQYVEIFAVTSL